jgi:sulfite reductase beta subunit-like hemoprotein
LALFTDGFQKTVAFVFSRIEARGRFWEEFFSSSITAKVLAGDEAAAARETLALLNRPEPRHHGSVAIVGAGPGLDLCSLANARSIPILRWISERFAALDRQHEIGELAVKISGCINACGHHHVGHIGILGVDWKGEEYYQITLGGNPESNTSSGKIIGPAFSSTDIVNAVEMVVDTYFNNSHSGERCSETYSRLGEAPFKEAPMILVQNGQTTGDT